MAKLLAPGVWQLDNGQYYIPYNAAYGALGNPSNAGVSMLSHNGVNAIPLSAGSGPFRGYVPNEGTNFWNPGTYQTDAFGEQQLVGQGLDMSKFYRPSAAEMAGITMPGIQQRVSGATTGDEFTPSQPEVWETPDLSYGFTFNTPPEGLQYQFHADAPVDTSSTGGISGALRGFDDTWKTPILMGLAAYSGAAGLGELAGAATGASTTGAGTALAGAEGFEYPATAAQQAAVTGGSTAAAGASNMDFFDFLQQTDATPVEQLTTQAPYSVDYTNLGGPNIADNPLNVITEPGTGMSAIDNPGQVVNLSGGGMTAAEGVASQTYYQLLNAGVTPQLAQQVVKAAIAQSSGQPPAPGSPTLQSLLSSIPQGAWPILGGLLGAAGANTQQTTTTSSTTPWAPASPYLTQSLEAASKYASSPLPYANPGEMVAGLTPEQQAGAATTMNLSGGAGDVVSQAQANIAPFLSGQYMDVNTNPYLQSAIEAATRPITENYQENVVPGIRTQFSTGTDAFDQSREGIAQGVAARGYLNAVRDAAASMANRGYETGLQATQNAFSQVPALTTAATQPGQAQWNVGQLLQAQQQKQIDAKQQYDLLQQNRVAFPFNIYSGVGRGGQVQTTQAPQANPYLAALGGAITASQIPKLFGTA